MARHAKDQSIWRDFSGPDWIQPEYWRRPGVDALIGLGALALGTILVVQIPGEVREGLAMTGASECAKESIAHGGCLEPVAAVILEKDDYRKTARTDWTLESQSNGHPRFEMESGGTNASKWDPGDRVKLLLWNSKPIKMESASVGSSPVRAIDWGHGPWLWKSLLSPILAFLGVVWLGMARRDRRVGSGWWRLPEPQAGLPAVPTWFDFIAMWFLGSTLGLIVWFFWGGVASTATTTIGVWSLGCVWLVWRLVRQTSKTGQTLD